MKRHIEQKLIAWKDSRYRKPLIIRGARQVGKTYTITKFGKEHFEKLIVFDFEQEKSLFKIFNQDLRPEKILMQLEVHADERILPGKALIFFDEIQSCAPAMLSLRYFYEQMADLHIIAAGSLLEFVMAELSFPVGRVEFLWMRPMTFIEFLEASGKNLLAEKIPRYSDFSQINLSIHEKCLDELKLYFLIGGMPEAVFRFLETNSFTEIKKVQELLVHSYLQSFMKYNKRVDIDSLEYVLQQIPRQIGNQVKYTNLDPQRRIEKTKSSIQVLQRALIIHQVRSSVASGLPLGADVSAKIFKYIFLDIGLMQHICGIDPNELLQNNDIMNVYRGALAEQFVGQELLAGQTASENNFLYYWSRHKRNSSAEVDFLIVRGGEIYPVEVKSGPTGKLRSMHLFLKEHRHCPKGIVLTSSVYEKSLVDNLIFLPLYVRLE